MGRKTAVSLVSYSPVPRDDADRLIKTLAKMTQHVREAGAQNADLVVFPEICAYLNAPDTWDFETLDGPTLTVMATAQAHSVYVFVPQVIIEAKNATIARSCSTIHVRSSVSIIRTRRPAANWTWGLFPALSRRHSRPTSVASASLYVLTSIIGESGTPSAPIART